MSHTTSNFDNSFFWQQAEEVIEDNNEVSRVIKCHKTSVQPQPSSRCTGTEVSPHYHALLAPQELKIRKIQARVADLLNFSDLQRRRRP